MKAEMDIEMQQKRRVVEAARDETVKRDTMEAQERAVMRQMRKGNKGC